MANPLLIDLIKFFTEEEQIDQLIFEPLPYNRFRIFIALPGEDLVQVYGADQNSGIHDWFYGGKWVEDTKKLIEKRRAIFLKEEAEKIKNATSLEKERRERVNKILKSYK